MKTARCVGCPTYGSWGKFNYVSGIGCLCKKCEFRVCCYNCGLNMGEIREKNYENLFGSENFIEKYKEGEKTFSLIRDFETFKKPMCMFKDVKADVKLVRLIREHVGMRFDDIFDILHFIDRSNDSSDPKVENFDYRTIVKLGHKKEKLSEVYCKWCMFKFMKEYVCKKLREESEEKKKSSSVEVDSLIKKTGYDIFGQIVSYLCFPKDVIRLSLVCKSWEYFFKHSDFIWLTTLFVPVRYKLHFQDENESNELDIRYSFENGEAFYKSGDDKWAIWNEVDPRIEKVCRWNNEKLIQYFSMFLRYCKGIKLFSNIKKIEFESQNGFLYDGENGFPNNITDIGLSFLLNFIEGKTFERGIGGKCKPSIFMNSIVLNRSSEKMKDITICSPLFETIQPKRRMNEVEVLGSSGNSLYFLHSLKNWNFSKLILKNVASIIMRKFITSEFVFKNVRSLEMSGTVRDYEDDSKISSLRIVHNFPILEELVFDASCFEKDIFPTVEFLKSVSENANYQESMKIFRYSYSTSENGMIELGYLMVNFSRLEVLEFTNDIDLEDSIPEFSLKLFGFKPNVELKTLNLSHGSIKFTKRLYEDIVKLFPRIKHLILNGCYLGDDFVEICQNILRELLCLTTLSVMRSDFEGLFSDLLFRKEGIALIPNLKYLFVSYKTDNRDIVHLDDVKFAKLLKNYKELKVLGMEKVELKVFKTLIDNIPPKLESVHIVVHTVEYDGSSKEFEGLMIPEGLDLRFHEK